MEDAGRLSSVEHFVTQRMIRLVMMQKLISLLRSVENAERLRDNRMSNGKTVEQYVYSKLTTISSL